MSAEARALHLIVVRWEIGQPVEDFIAELEARDRSAWYDDRDFVSFVQGGDLARVYQTGAVLFLGDAYDVIVLEPEDVDRILESEDAT